MTIYHDFNDFLSIGGVDLSAYLRAAKVTRRVETRNISGGSGSSNKHRRRGEGLDDYMFEATLLHDSTDIQTILAELIGEQPVIFGPEGSTGGQPKHVQNFIITEVPIGGDYENSDGRVIVIQGEAAAEPSVDMYNAGVWS